MFQQCITWKQSRNQEILNEAFLNAILSIGYSNIKLPNPTCKCIQRITKFLTHNILCNISENKYNTTCSTGSDVVKTRHRKAHCKLFHFSLQGCQLPFRLFIFFQFYLEVFQCLAGTACLNFSSNLDT